MTGPRNDGRLATRAATWCALVTLSVLPSFRLSAQFSLSLSGGARYTSTLVRDSIGADAITLRPAIAPALHVGLSTALDGPWSAAVAVDLATSTLSRELGRLTTAALTVTLRRTLDWSLSAFAGVGALSYLPADDAGVFSRGSGSPKTLGVAGVAWDPPFGARQRLRVEARYDFHRFLTPALRDTGFTDARAVHRVALLLGVSRTLGR